MESFVKNLLLKHSKGRPLTEVTSLTFTQDGILNNVKCLPLRQVLILPTSTLEKYNLALGDLRENIVVDFDQIHELRSGTIIRIGEALIRLSFHCEPCKVISNKVKPSSILHNRGVLGLFLNSGKIYMGDRISIQESKDVDVIPYEIRKRIMWYLDKANSPILANKLLYDIGLSTAYARALPQLIKSLPSQYQFKILYKKRSAN